MILVQQFERLRVADAISRDTAPGLRDTATGAPAGAGHRVAARPGAKPDSRAANGEP
ncbi:hypothetical protein ABZ371_20995 [Streptomyces sp. NPDC005899]|uniref:hypothetical protein n=1 Tax=Streptomyces sp. NPDC005899 TaxID=3155716 RepID=UPI0033DA658B